MKVYYIEYTNSDDKLTLEAFKSRTLAQRRVSEMAKEYKRIKKLWQEYIISRKGKPSEKPIDPPEISEVDFDLNAQGILEAFTFYANRR